MLARLKATSHNPELPGEHSVYVNPKRVTSITPTRGGKHSWVTLDSGKVIVVDGTPDEVHRTLVQSR